LTLVSLLCCSFKYSLHPPLCCCSLSPCIELLLTLLLLVGVLYSPPFLPCAWRLEIRMLRVQT
jgi:hypothetical protein